jgi:uncharacterized membrane protein YfcA
MIGQSNPQTGSSISASKPSNSARREFFTRVLPLALAVWAIGIALSYLQHGFLIGGSRGVPLAGPECHPALWHLLLLGFIGGFVMALVGNGTGLVSLPYDMSVLGFNTVSVSPTVQLETFLNPFGALIGFFRSGQFNGAFALPLCVGAAIGAVVGPFIRVLWLPNPVPFKGAVGVALIFVGFQMLYGIFKPRRATGNGGNVSGKTMSIRTLEKTWTILRIGFGDEERRMSMIGLAVLGAGVSVVGTTLGVGGGFLLVPLLVAFYRLPMRVIVAGSIPFIIVLSAVGLFSFNVTVPLLTGHHVATEWAWGFFTGGAAILGAWFATHSQRHIPEGILRGILGICNALVGVLYVLGYFGMSPIKI